MITRERGVEVLNEKGLVDFLLFPVHMTTGVVRAYVAVSTGVPMTSFLQKGSVTREWAFQTKAVRKKLRCRTVSKFPLPNTHW